MAKLSASSIDQVQDVGSVKGSGVTLCLSDHDQAQQWRFDFFVDHGSSQHYVGSLESVAAGTGNPSRVIGWAVSTGCVRWRVFARPLAVGNRGADVKLIGGCGDVPGMYPNGPLGLAVYV